MVFLICFRALLRWLWNVDVVCSNAVFISPEVEKGETDGFELKLQRWESRLAVSMTIEIANLPERILRMPI
jgi:hypothetical protein